MRITYGVLCKKCEEEGDKEARLHRDLNNPEVVYCSEGHQFTGPEIEDYLTGETEVQPETSVPKMEFVPMPSIPGGVTEEMEKILQAAVDKTYKFTPPPAEVPGARTAAAAIAQQEQAGRKIIEHWNRPTKAAPEVVEAPKAAVAVAEPEPGRRTAPEAPQMPSRARKGVRELPGGALEITVVVPDNHASFLKGEAETRGKTVEEHFREMVEYGLDARWFYLLMLALIGRHLF